jgi:hypothetical protein
MFEGNVIDMAKVKRRHAELCRDAFSARRAAHHARTELGMVVKECNGGIAEKRRATKAAEIASQSASQRLGTFMALIRRKGLLISM